jgi:hypothetical protein
LICAVAITWQVRKTKATEKKLAEDAISRRMRADKGDAKAESELAYMYSHGQGVPEDYSEALRWRGKAANQGYAGGEDGLGYMYLHGLGVPQDYAEALRWYRKAADQGDAMGQNSLALMYEQGLGAPQDYAEALRWYRKAVDQGYASAQYNLGNMYYYGRGVPQDYAEAVRWYRKAADQGDEYAQRALHVKWRGLSTFSKITISTIFLGSSLMLIGSLMPRGSFGGWQWRTTTAAGLAGLCYVALDLCGFRYINILTPVSAIGAFSFVKSLFAGTSLAFLLHVVLPNNLWPKIIKIVLGLFGLLFVGLNLYVIANYKLRSIAPTLRSFWSINGMLLGIAISLGICLWLTHTKFKLEQNLDGDVIASDSPINNNGDRA